MVKFIGKFTFVISNQNPWNENTSINRTLCCLNFIPYFQPLKSGHLTVKLLRVFGLTGDTPFLLCIFVRKLSHKYNSITLFFFLYTFTLFHTGVIDEAVTVSFDPTTYTVTEGVDSVANLMLVTSKGLTRTVVVTVTTASGTAMGMAHHSILCTTITCCSHSLYTISLLQSASVGFVIVGSHPKNIFVYHHKTHDMYNVRCITRAPRL